MTEMGSILAARNEVARMNRLCEELLCVRPRLYRAPFSDTSEKLRIIVRAEGMEEILWHIDSCDWYAEFAGNPQQILSRITGPELTSGAILQFHLDGHHTAQVLDEAIPII